ncbi:MAG: PriCT-2 domain-containing protein, partial [Bacteroidaceae bacterium]|nr:PriCT-2 domain-containing protein [Bacteroidaceae bacterium]
MTSQNFYLNLLNDGATPSDTATRVESLIAQLKASHTDITSGYTEWLKVGFAIASEFGETGRRYFHDISALYTGYDATECDKKYDECLKSDNGRTNIATLFYLAEQQGVKLPHQERNISHNQAHIPTDATSDKNVAVSFVESQAEDRTLPLLDPSVYTNLPSILRKAVATMHIRQEKDLVLIGSIVTLSSVLLPFRT